MINVTPLEPPVSRLQDIEECHIVSGGSLQELQPLRDVVIVDAEQVSLHLPHHHLTVVPEEELLAEAVSRIISGRFLI